MSNIKVIALPLVLFCAFGGFEFYSAHSKGLEFKERIHGMTEDELCYLAADEFGLDAVIEIGCLGNTESNTDLGG